MTEDFGAKRHRQSHEIRRSLESSSRGCLKFDFGTGEETEGT